MRASINSDWKWNNYNFEALDSNHQNVKYLKIKMLQGNSLSKMNPIIIRLILSIEEGAVESGYENAWCLN